MATTCKTAEIDGRIELHPAHSGGCRAAGCFSLAGHAPPTESDALRAGRDIGARLPFRWPRRETGKNTSCSPYRHARLTWPAAGGERPNAEKVRTCAPSVSVRCGRTQLARLQPELTDIEPQAFADRMFGMIYEMDCDRRACQPASISTRSPDPALMKLGNLREGRNGQAHPY